MGIIKVVLLLSISNICCIFVAEKECFFIVE